MLLGQLEKATRIVYARKGQTDPNSSNETVEQPSATGQNFVFGGHGSEGSYVQRSMAARRAEPTSVSRLWVLCGEVACECA